MTHCPVRVRDPTRVTFDKSFVPSSNVKIFIYHYKCIENRLFLVCKILAAI